MLIEYKLKWNTLKLNSLIHITEQYQSRIN